MVKTIIAFLCVGFALGYLYAKFHQNRKAQKKRDRRNRMINTLQNMTDRKCRWDIEHERLPKAKGFRVFKGGMDKMTEAQFQAARLQIGQAFTAALSAPADESHD